MTITTMERAHATLRARAAAMMAVRSWHVVSADDDKWRSCRFCKRSILDVPDRAVWKYAVRHYVCGECRLKILREARLLVPIVEGIDAAIADLTK